MKLQLQIDEFDAEEYQVTIFNDQDDYSLTIKGETYADWQDSLIGDQCTSQHHMAEARNITDVTMYDADDVAQPSVCLKFLELARAKIKEIEIELDRVHCQYNLLSGLV